MDEWTGGASCVTFICNTIGKNAVAFVLYIHS